MFIYDIMTHLALICRFINIEAVDLKGCNWAQQTAEQIVLLLYEVIYQFKCKKVNHTHDHINIIS